MRIALGQLNTIWEDRDASIERAKPMIAEAAAAGADLIVFPEMSFTGVSLNIDTVAEPQEASTTVDTMKELAKRHHIAIAFGWAALPEHSGNLAENRITLLDADGMQVGD